jgi:hypothetical protein
VNTSASSTLRDENSETSAPSGPAWNQLLRAVAVGVHVREEDQPLALEVVEPEIGELDPLDLLGGQDDPRGGELGGGSLAEIH